MRRIEERIDDCGPGDVIELARRLVSENQSGRAGEGASHGNSLRLSAGELVGQRTSECLEAEAFEGVVRLVARLLV